MFSCEFYEMFKDTLFIEHLRMLLLCPHKKFPDSLTINTVNTYYERKFSWSYVTSHVMNSGYKGKCNMCVMTEKEAHLRFYHTSLMGLKAINNFRKKLHHRHLRGS